MANLNLYLLGPTQVKLDEKHIEVKPRKALALLIYLAVTADRQSRDSLATLLWSHSDQRNARHSLRSRLSELNQSLGDAWIEADRETVGLRAGFWLDVTEFQHHLAAETDDPQPLIAAADLYRGDFLTGFSLLNCPEFDEWQFFQAESLRQTLASLLKRLVVILSGQTNHQKAIPYARRWLALDPLHEAAHRQLMHLYAQTGQQVAALRQYELCHQTLQDELGVSPSPETTALYHYLQAQKVTDGTSKPHPYHNLPIQTTTFIGREAELADIKRRLLDEPDCRLLNLVGPGGIGKTRLALAAAAQTLYAFPDGTYFVSLAPISEVGDIVPAIAEALRLTFHSQKDPKVQLFDYLRQKRLLLVIDNFEHLFDGADLLSEILGNTSNVTFLATSRERLNLQEEWGYEVQGLSFPAAEDEGLKSTNRQALQAYSAVQLFLQRTRQAAAHFAPSAEEMVSIGRICQLVEGMPLGLELAAPWIKVLSCQEIAAEIEHSLDFLATTLQNVPERHRSLRAVFEQTWDRLSPAEQSVLRQLSVFRGGCTRDAAEQVTGATLPVLSSLVDRTLLRRTNTGRYEIHELIRQFAKARLQSDPQMADEASQQHRAFFITFLEAHTAGAKGRRQLETLAEIEADMDNVRLAWRGAVANRESGAIERSAECLFVYYLYRNGYDEGQSEFRRAVAAYATLPDIAADDSWPKELVVQGGSENLVGFLLAGLGYFVAHRRNLQQGQDLLEQALALLRRTAPVDRCNEAFVLLWLGWALYFQGQLTEGKRYAKEGQTFFSETADHWGKGWALLLLGNCLRDGRPAEAVGVYQTGMALCRESGDEIVLSYLNLGISIASKELGRYTQAQQYIETAISTSWKLNNFLGLSYSLFHRGRLEISQGKYHQAIQTLQQALTYFNRVGTVHASRAQIYLGLAHRLQGDYDLAAQLYDQALEGLKAANSKLELTRCLNGLGCLAYAQGKFHQAEQFQRESLAILQETDQGPALVAATVCHLGQVMVALGKQRHTQARNHFRHGLELAQEHQLAPIALDVCVDVAQLLALAGDVERAIELLTLAEQHIASTFETRKRAQHYRIECTDRLFPETAQVAQVQGQTLDLWETVQELVAGLTTDAM